MATESESVSSKINETAAESNFTVSPASVSGELADIDAKMTAVSNFAKFHDTTLDLTSAR